MDFSGIIKQTVGAGIEREAYKQFGAAVEEFTQGTLGSVFGTKQVSNDISKVDQSTRENFVWDPTHYASALTMAGGFNPRLKFLFKVRFEFHPKVKEYLDQISPKATSDFERDLTFMVKSVDKPKFDFTYEEVNMYNFRTKVLKSITSNEISLSFFDDATNNVFDFINLYVQALKPISRMANAGQILDNLEDYGFAFSQQWGVADTSMRGAFDETNNLLSKITVYQFYVLHNNEATANTQMRVKSNKFVFVNPRINRIDMDDLDSEGNTFNTASIKFDFDALHMESNKTVISDTDGGKYPEHPKGDILFSVGENPAALNQKGFEIFPIGNKTPFADVIARQGARAAQQSVSGLLNKKFGKTKAGRALANTFNTAGGAAGGAVGGALQNATGAVMGGLTLGVSQALARPSTPKVKDNSTGGQEPTRVVPPDTLEPI